MLKMECCGHFFALGLPAIEGPRIREEDLHPSMKPLNYSAEISVRAGSYKYRIYEWFVG